VNPKGKAYITRTVKPGAYVDAFPAGLKPYIKFVKDVAADGNCGFRAIAASIGHTKDDWAEVSVTYWVSCTHTKRNTLYFIGPMKGLKN